MFYFDVDTEYEEALGVLATKQLGSLKEKYDYLFEKWSYEEVIRVNNLMLSAYSEIKINAVCNSDFEEENDIPVQMRLNRLKFWKKVLSSPKNTRFKEEALSEAIGYTNDCYTVIRY